MNEPEPLVTHLFAPGDHALLIDKRKRRYLVQLEPGKSYHTHHGNFAHDELLGKPEGIRVMTSKGHWLLVFKPTMADFIRLMPRIATVVYPKDLGMITTYADVFPGARILEAGAGSGSLTIALARAVGVSGKVYSYDVREDMLARAGKNVAAFMSDCPQVVHKLGDVAEIIEEADLDRIVLDLPEPWRVVRNAAAALASGGVFLSFLPTILQVQQLVLELADSQQFGLIETFETLQRGWSVSQRSLRPDHRMVGHTGFITTARKCEPGAIADPETVLDDSLEDEDVVT